MKNKFLLMAMMGMSICGMLCSCKPNNQKLIVGKWYCDDNHCEIQWVEFKPDGILIDADGGAYEYKISEDDLIVSNNAGSRALKIVELTKQHLVLQRESIIMRFGKENADCNVSIDYAESEEIDTTSVADEYDVEEAMYDGEESNETISEEYFDNGNVRKKTIYRNGLKYKTTEYFENGKVYEEMVFDKNGDYFGDWRRYGPDLDGHGYYLIFENKIDANGNGYEWYRYDESRRRATNFSFKTTYVNHRPVSEVCSELVNGEWREVYY